MAEPSQSSTVMRPESLDTIADPASVTFRLFKNGLDRPLHEFRGIGRPPDNLAPVPAAGDIYLDLSNPHRVFYLGASAWIEWTGLSTQCSHPTQNDKTLYPDPKKISWGKKRRISVVITTLKERQAQDYTPHEHVMAILQTEAQANPILRDLAQKKREKRIANAMNRSTSVLSATPSAPAEPSTSSKRKRPPTGSPDGSKSKKGK
jgi:hypothetical protein